MAQTVYKQLILTEMYRKSLEKMLRILTNFALVYAELTPGRSLQETLQLNYSYV